MRIAILGGTGPAGQAMAARLASVGFDTTIGSRDATRAAEVRDHLVAKWSQYGLPIGAADNEAAAANCDHVILATPWDIAAETARSVATLLRGKVVISMANALFRVGHEFQPLVPPRGSVAGNVQAAVPGALVAAAFHHVPAKDVGNLNGHIDSDVLICSDHPVATQVASTIANRVPGLRALDAGELSNALAIEAFAAVLLQLNHRYKAKVAVKLTGIGADPRLET